ncbi:MAG: hypothetical protein IJS37_01565 [Bacilli bacterium]|nr:hypothetical protein [Bacilli bacterium]
MLKQYIKWQISKWWPIMLVGALLLAIPFVSIMQSSSIVYKTAPYHSQYIPISNTAFIALAIMASMFALALPAFIFVYRGSLQAVDCFYQAGFEARTIRRTRVILGLVFLLVAFTVAYWIGVFVLGMRYIATPAVVTTDTSSTVRADIHFGYFALAYLAFVVILAAQYFTNCFFASLGDQMFVQIALMVCGLILQSLIMMAPVLYCEMTASLSGRSGDPLSAAFRYCYGPIGMTSALVQLISPLIEGGQNPWGANSIWWVMSLVISVLFGAGSCVYLFISKEPSGEYAGHWKARNVYIGLIPHVTALVIGVALSTVVGINTGVSIVSGYALMLFFDVSYFALLALLRKSFKPAKLDLILYLSVVGVVLLLSLAMTVVASAAYGR